MANPKFDNMLAFMSEGPGLIRYTAIARRLEANGGSVEALEKGVNSAGRTCDTHGYLYDPVIGVDTVLMRIIVGCPWCSGGNVLEAWSAQDESS